MSHERGGCATDPARNTVMLKFPDSVAGGGIVTTAGPVFFDAKMAIDADGSALSKAAERPNQPETALRYPTNGESLDSERVPYIVMPLGNFRQETGVTLGDLAVVVKDGQVHFAIVGDLGPRTHLGEGSMALHAAFGHLDCKAHDAQGNCSQFVDVSLDPPVLYFVFPDSRSLLIDGLGPENVNARIERFGMQLWGAFLIEQGGMRADVVGVDGVSPGDGGRTISRAYSALSFSIAANPALAGWAEMSRAFGAGGRGLPQALVASASEMRGSFASLRMTHVKCAAGAGGVDGVSPGDGGRTMSRAYSALPVSETSLLEGNRSPSMMDSRWLGQESISQGLKPRFWVGLNVRAKARTYLRSKDNSNANPEQAVAGTPSEMRGALHYALLHPSGQVRPPGTPVRASVGMTSVEGIATPGELPRSFPFNAFRVRMTPFNVDAGVGGLGGGGLPLGRVAASNEMRGSFAPLRMTHVKPAALTEREAR